MRRLHQKALRADLRRLLEEDRALGQLVRAARARAAVDARTDDGLAQQVFAEAGVPETEVPTFAFFAECLELKKWRMTGSSDAGELVRRTRRIAADPNDPALDDGPEEEE